MSGWLPRPFHRTRKASRTQRRQFAIRISILSSRLTGASSDCGDSRPGKRVPKCRTNYLAIMKSRSKVAANPSDSGMMKRAVKSTTQENSMKQIIIIAGLAGSIAWAALGAEPALTIYNQNFAVVRDTLPLDLQAGVNTVRYA